MTMEQAEPGGVAELNHPHPLRGLRVDVEDESELVGVKGFGLVDVGDRDRYEFELHVHSDSFGWVKVQPSTAPRSRGRWSSISTVRP